MDRDVVDQFVSEAERHRHTSSVEARNGGWIVRAREPHSAYELVVTFTQDAAGLVQATARRRHTTDLSAEGQWSLGTHSVPVPHDVADLWRRLVQAQADAMKEPRW